MSDPQPNRESEVRRFQKWIENETCLRLLGQDLVPSDCHEEEGAMMTENREFYFVPHIDDPVIARGIKERPTNRPKWGVEVLVCYTSYQEPDDYDFAEEGDRADSLVDAIAEASRIQHERKIRNIGEGIFWESEQFVIQ